MLTFDNSVELQEADKVIVKAESLAAPTRELEIALQIVKNYRRKLEAATDTLVRLEYTARLHAAAGILNVMIS